MQSRHTILGIIAVAAAMGSIGCGKDSSCAIDADCFAGEYCGSEQTCIAGTRSQNNNPQTNNVAGNSDAGPGNIATDGAVDVDATTDVADRDGGGTCEIDPFGNVCADDEFEENDLYTQTLPIPLAQDSWCLDGDLVAPSQSFSGTLCPGDQADLFRIFIDNRTPHECLSDAFTIQIVVELDQPCDATELVRIFPYLSFENPNLNSPCGQSDDIRCTVSDDQKTHTFEVLWQSEQMPDQRLIIEPRGDNVQVDYTVTVDIIQ